MKSLNLRIAEELSVKEQQVAATVELIDGGSTVPFIARYRKEITGALDDTQLRTLDERLRYLRELEERLAISGEWEQKPKPTTQAAPPQDIADKARFFPKIQLMLDMARLAFESDSTRIITLMVDGFATPVFEIDDHQRTRDGSHQQAQQGIATDMRGPQARRVGSGTVHGTVPQGGQACIPHHQVQRHHKDGHACDARAQGQLIGEKHIHHHSQRHPKNIGHGLAPRLVVVVDQLHVLNPTNQQTFGAPSQQQRHGHKEKHAAPVRSQVFAGRFNDAQDQSRGQ